MREGPAQCDVTIAVPPFPEAVKKKRIASCPPQIIEWQPFLTQFVGCDTCIGPIPHTGACFTGTCQGPQTQIEPSTDPKKACGCTAPQPLTDWENVADGLPWPSIEQELFQCPEPTRRAAGGFAGATTSEAAPRSFSSHELLAELKRIESDVHENISAVFRISEPRSWMGPDKGTETALCKVSVSDASVGLSCKYDYLTDPRFSASYVPHGRLASEIYGEAMPVWRPLQYHLLSDATVHRTLIRQELVLVRPRGELLRIPHGTLMVLQEPVGSPHGMHQLDHFLLAAGTGFTRYLEQIRGLEELDSDMWRLTVSGAYGVPGIWHLLIDTAHGNPIVREASLFKARDGTLLLRTKAMGTCERDGLTLGASGSVEVFVTADREPDVRTFELLSFSKQADSTHLGRLRELHAAPLPAETPVFDSSAEPSP